MFHNSIHSVDDELNADRRRLQNRAPADEMSTHIMRVAVLVCSLLSTDASAAHVESMGSPREGWYLTHRGGLCPYVSASWTMVLSLRVASSSSRNPNGVAEQDAQGSGAWGFRSTFAGKCRASPHACGSPEESAGHQRASLPPLPCDTPHGRLQHEGRGLLQHA